MQIGNRVQEIQDRFNLKLVTLGIRDTHGLYWGDLTDDMEDLFNLDNMRNMIAECLQNAPE